MEKIKGDLAQVKKENKSLVTKLQAAGAWAEKE